MKHLNQVSIANPKLDKRRKLTLEQREEIFKNIRNLSKKELALMYKVSIRTIDFILNPEKKKENQKRTQENGGWKLYYDKEKHREKMKKHYQYKKELKNKGLI